MQPWTTRTGKAMPQPFPAREAVAVLALPKGARVEISMIAQKV